jgi:hypothetical protein
MRRLMVNGLRMDRGQVWGLAFRLVYLFVVDLEIRYVPYHGVIDIS